MREQKFSGTYPTFVGCAALCALVCGFGAWAMFTTISGAIIADGALVVENNRQVVQHSDGGIVTNILAREGDRVEAGDILIQLDPTQVKSEISVSQLQLVELQARRARLEAERDNRKNWDFAIDTAFNTGARARTQIEGQMVLFQARLETFENELAQISERQRQKTSQVEGVKAQLSALEIQLALAKNDLSVQEDALARGLTESSKVSTLQREVARLQGEIGRLTSEGARLEGEIGSLETESIRLSNRRRETAIVELRDIQYQELELQERLIVLHTRLDQFNLKAPVSGVVHNSVVFTKNSVVRPAEPAMYIVPSDQPLLVDVKVPSHSIDQIASGQSATLRFSAFDTQEAPEMFGSVTRISADAIRPDSGAPSYYRVSVQPDAEKLISLGDRLIPGMPVEVYFRTEERSPLSYLSKPLARYLARAFRES